MPAAAMRVRNLRPGEGIPAGITGTGFEDMELDPTWVWVVEYRGRRVAILFTANAHGLLILLRMAATKGAPKTWPMLLLPQVFATAKARGCKGYYTFLDDREAAEVKLMRIVLKSGGGLLPASGAWAMNTFMEK